MMGTQEYKIHHLKKIKNKNKIATPILFKPIFTLFEECISSKVIVQANFTAGAGGPPLGPRWMDG